MPAEKSPGAPSALPLRGSRIRCAYTLKIPDPMIIRNKKIVEEKHFWEGEGPTHFGPSFVLVRCVGAIRSEQKTGSGSDKLFLLF